jgi:peptidyl-prolyl cis-trans isomerase SurA
MSLVRNLILGVAFALAFGAAGAFAQSETSLHSETPQGDAPADVQAPGTAAVRPTLNEGIAAVVNDEIVSTYDLRQRMLLLMVTSGVQPTEQNIPEIQREALRSLVDEHLQMQEIRRIEQKQKDLHLEATPKEIDDEIKGMAEQNNIKAEQLLGTLKSAGVDAQTLRDQLGAQMAWRHYMGGRFGSEIHIGDEQIAASEARLLASSQKSQYLVSEIFLDAARVGGQTSAEDGANQLVAQIKQGAPFPAVARQFSALPTAANGGDSGWLNADEIQPALETALEGMRPGQMSGPIPVKDGVYILLLRDKRAGSNATVVDLKQAAIRLPETASAEDVAAASAKLEKLKAEFTGCKDLEVDASKMSGVVAGDLGQTEITDLSPDFRQVVDTLKVGQIGGPVRTRAGVHLIAVCGRHASGAKAASRDDIENRLYGEQLSMIARRFLRDLRNSATIESR